MYLYYLLTLRSVWKLTMTGKSQNELEQPAKVYQLDAVENKVDLALGKLDQIVSSIDGVVTNIQLESRLKKMEEDIKSDVDIKYGPIKNGAWVVLGAVVLGIVTQIVLNLLNLGGK